MVVVIVVVVVEVERIMGGPKCIRMGSNGARCVWVECMCVWV